MTKTIIFISGFLVPKFIAKTSIVWDDSIWKNHNRIYITSKIPTSDVMVNQTLDELAAIVNQYENVVLAGQSLGAWWAANLVCHPKVKIENLALWTPLLDTTYFPFLNVTQAHNPRNKTIPNYLYQKDKICIFSATDDLITPEIEHDWVMFTFHNHCQKYNLNGGHYFQKNHKEALLFLRDWIK